MIPTTPPAVPVALWEYMARQVVPAVEGLYEGDEAQSVVVFDVEVTFQEADAANVGRLLDYLDFMFRWTESVVESFQGAEPPGVIEPAHHKVPVFEIISTQPGSFIVRLRAMTATTILVVTNVLNLFNAAAEAVDHVNGWRHERETVQIRRDGQEKSAVSLPGPSDAAAHQAWQVCGKPESFVEIHSHFKTADGTDWSFSAKFPAHQPAHDDLYLQQIERIIGRASGER
ncbi:hypothetical protein [Streptomyces sp. NPDC013740]|uniref:hypothetical protein n=1 Tax=Streptomyces sp. NPDC013740 TaxID=3364867 RepID=UPI00370248B8